MIEGAKRELASIAALAMAVTVAVVAVRSERALRQQVVRMEKHVARAYVQDRLVGTTIDGAALAFGDEPPGHAIAERTVLWILDLERCPECLDELGPWTRLEKLDGHAFSLVLVGLPSPAHLTKLRVMKHTHVLVSTREHVREAVGTVLPNTKMLLDDAGLVILVDSRESAAGCGTTFEGQVGAVAGRHHNQPGETS